MTRWTARLVATVTLVALGAPLIAAAPLAVTGEAQREVMVTVYNGNLGIRC